MVDGGAGDSVARESEGLGNVIALAPCASTNCPLRAFHLSLFHPSHVSAIYCSHSAGSQHKYVTPMAAPIAPGPRIPPLPSEGRTLSNCYIGAFENKLARSP